MVAKAVVVVSGDMQATSEPTAPGQDDAARFHSVALMPAANRALIIHALEALRLAGVERTAVLAEPQLLPRLREAVAEEGFCAPPVCWLDSGSSGALERLARFADGDPVAVHLADSLSHSRLEGVLEAPRRASDAIAVVQGASEGGVVDLALRRFARRTSTSGPGGNSAGVWVLGNEALLAACELGTGAGFEAGVLAAIERAPRVETVEVRDWWRCRNGQDAVLEANRFALEGLTAEPTSATLIDTRLQAAVAVHRSARLESSVVRGPAVIGPGVRLRDAYVGPYSSIGRDVVIEGAELEHSVVLPGSSIRYLGGRLEASVVGPRAHVCRDFRLPRALRLTLGEGAEVSLA